MHAKGMVCEGICVFVYLSVRRCEKRVLPAALLMMPLFDLSLCVCVSRAALRQAVIDGVC